ncbi:MAG: hypothetical protein ACK5H4_15215 [Lacrimispora sphenoides]
MPNVVTLWSPFILTDNGLALRQRAIAGDGTLSFAYAKIGEGIQININEIPLMTDLVTPSEEVPVIRTEATGATHILGVRIDNQDFAQPVLMTELGVFAQIDDEAPIMYGYSYATQGYDSIPAGSTSHYVWTITIDTVISRATSITFNYDRSDLYVTFNDLNVLDYRVTVLESQMTQAGYYYSERGSITDGSFYEDYDHTIEMEKRDRAFYVDIISRRLYWFNSGKYELISPTDTPDWNATSGPGYIANKPEVSGRNAIRVITNGNFTLTADDPWSDIIGMGVAYFKHGLDFNSTNVTISGITASQVQNNGPSKPVRIYAQIGITTTAPGKKTISIHSYDGSSSSLHATGQIYAPVAGAYTVATYTSINLVTARYVYIRVSGAVGDVVVNQNNLTFLAVEEI